MFNTSWSPKSWLVLMTRGLVLSVFWFIGTYHIVQGLRVVTMEHPWEVDGSDSWWMSLSTASDASPATVSVFRRLGTFTFGLGLLTVTWAALVAKSRVQLSIMFAVYLAFGFLFFWEDNAYGTSYFSQQSIFGGIFITALVLHHLLYVDPDFGHFFSFVLAVVCRQQASPFQNIGQRAAPQPLSLF
eukprot:gnl/Hemi2/14111_TR4789_c0_g1_i1.p1 gnl/Hemi2/14111_TR4789_c0_g1~~gnl/Hemi2/14111_TR4789_c0_g1_i1.p1  ORF type:complete len:186 (+),score=17.68 gnl/Hemi2/14111_TR4789_c0_g1_i1:98-655(+)